jgi:hypothetical protein
VLNERRNPLYSLLLSTRDSPAILDAWILSHSRGS